MAFLVMDRLGPGLHNGEVVLFWMLKCTTVEPPIKDTPNKGNLSIKDKSTRPYSYYTSTF